MPTTGYNAELLSGGLVKLWRINDWTLLGSYQIAGYSNGTWDTLTKARLWLRRADVA